VIIVEPPKPWKHVLVWIVGVVLASLAPFLWLYLANKPNSNPPSIYQMLDAGELYIIAIVVLIAGVTEIALLLRQIRQGLTVAMLMIGGLIFILVDAARYAGASELTANTHIPHSVAFWSAGAFIVSAVHSSICVWLAAGTR
jgi:hypothetical protein